MAPEPRTDDPAATEIVARDPIRDVGSSRAYSLALGCLQDCIANHNMCPKPANSPRLPTRVIDCLNPERPKLLTSHGEPGTYVALSYVWGGGQPNCTVTTNLDTYAHGISLDLIPRTIRDAIEATNKYGLRYLWVDSFCIIQDSREDKQVELTQLPRIFRDAYITIIASSAKSAFAGFLQDRDPPAPPPPRLPFWCKDGRLGSVSICPLFIPYDGSREPVNQRAWCLEERLLSARKLVYASDTIQYHCQTAVSYIGGAHAGPHKTEHLPDVMFVPDGEIPKHVVGWKRGNWRLLRMEWASVVMNYTGRITTKPGDKLTAFGAVAERFHRVWYPESEPGGTLMQGRYLAGLWEKFLPHDLLWTIREDTLPHKRPALYLAPSWSWASVDGQISLYYALDQRLDMAFVEDPTQLKQCEVLKCVVGLDDERLPHGKVNSGLLTIRSTMIPIKWNISSDESRLFTYRDNTEAGLETLDASRVDESLLCVGKVYVDSTEEVRGEVWAVPILWNMGPALEDIHAAGLFVTHASDKQFRRVGVWETPELSELGDSEEDMQSMMARFNLDGDGAVTILEII
ncbi:hypothetical protein VNI00_019016 [Paramarasmius palmivorus]|uniref:EF-hand domain-containing protein n=1 Tax=Paramarasmius palmivorus TaxID=297713 RepID=A0AAW0AS94_9AGAR